MFLHKERVVGSTSTQGNDALGIAREDVGRAVAQLLSPLWGGGRVRHHTHTLLACLVHMSRVMMMMMTPHMSSRVLTARESRASRACPRLLPGLGRADRLTMTIRRSCLMTWLFSSTMSTCTQIEHRNVPKTLPSSKTREASGRDASTEHTTTPRVNTSIQRCVSHQFVGR
jgi:hypothetical protein